MKTIKQILLGLVLVSLSATFFISCDEDEDRERPSTDTGTTTDTDTTADVEPVTTADICIECGENLFWYNSYMEKTDEIMNDTINFVSKLYRFGDYYRLNVDLFSEWHDVRAISFLICNQNNIKAKLDSIWNNFSKDGVWDVAPYHYDYRLVKANFVIAYKVINDTGLENHLLLESDKSIRFWNYGVYILNIEKTTEEFSWTQNGFNLDNFFEIQGFANH